MTLLRIDRGRPALSSFVEVILTAPTVMLACPVCGSPTGQQVRNGISGNDSGEHPWRWLRQSPSSCSASQPTIAASQRSEGAEAFNA